MAGKLGYRGAGLVYDDLVAARDIIGYAELSRILKGNGIVDLEVEILTVRSPERARGRISLQKKREWSAGCCYRGLAASSSKRHLRFAVPPAWHG